MANKTLSTILFIVYFLLGGFCADSGFAGGDVTFKRIQPKMVEVQFNKHSHWEYDEKVSRKKAEALYKYIHQQYKKKNGYAAIFACPGRADLFVIVSRIAPGTEKDFGKRFLLIKKTAKGFTLLDKSKGMMDSYILEPTFFTSKNKIVILGETGAEYSWGVVAYEIQKNKLKDLGTINVAKPTEESTDNPIPDAVLKLSGNKLRVEFHTDLVFDPGGRKDRLVKRVNGRPFVFEYNGKEFQFKKGKK